MELVKSKLSLSRQKCKAMTYVAKEEAFNFNESMEDIAHILQQRGEVNIHEIRAEENKVRLMGEISFSILYESASLERRLSGYSGRMSFEDEINLEGVNDNDDVAIQTDLEELKIEIVNSRKIRVNALVCLVAGAEDTMEEEILTDIENDETMLQTKKKQIRLLNKCVHNSEDCKIEAEAVLPVGHENIGKVIWYRITPYNVDFTNQDGKVLVNGDLQFSIIYQSENGMKTEFLQEEIPFSKNMSVDGCGDSSILNVKFNCVSSDVDVMADDDGEDRVMHISCVLALDMHVYKEETQEYVVDIYSLRHKINAEMSTLSCQNLLSQNISKCRLNEPVEIKKPANQVLQIMCSSGKIRNVKQSQNDGGILVQGELHISGLFITTDDEQPFESFEGKVSFEHFVEIPNMDVQSEYQSDIRLEQLTVGMSGESQMEVKALISIVILAYDINLHSVITGIEMSEPDMEMLKRIPAITGYVVREDDTLWDIAKNYMTTVEELKEINELKSEQIKAGDSIIIVKTVGECMNNIKQ